MARTIAKPVGGKPDKLIRDALKAAVRQEPHKLKRAAEKILDDAAEGSLAAMAFLAERIDGKVPQAIIGGDEDDPAINHDVSLKVQFVAAITERLTVERADTTT